MSKENLAVYLTDHLAGATAAVELLEWLESNHQGTDVGQFARDIRTEVEADRDELRTLMKQLNISESTTRKASAWLGEKATELKLWIDDGGGDELRLFESFEVLSLGIEGKRLLWLSLATAAEKNQKLQGLNYMHLIQRAEEQRASVDKKRLEAASRALR